VLRFVLLAALCACGPDPSTDLGPQPAVPGIAPVTRRLTSSQYDHALRDLFGDDLYVPAAPDPDLSLDGFARLGAAEVSTSPRGVERYEAAAYAVADQAVGEARRETWMPCAPSADEDDGCARAALAAVGRRAWRRPLTDDELQALAAVVDQAQDALVDEAPVHGPFWDALVYGLAVILQSPDFLMRPEPGEGEGGARRYTSLEMASRLSFFLWDSLPDEALLSAAERGDLTDDVALAAEVDRMLADPRARRGLRAWAEDLLDLDRLPSLQKDPAVFIYLRDGLLQAAREETLRAFEDLVFDDPRDFGDLLTTRRTYVDRSLAMLYRVPAPAADGFGLVELPADGARAGLLGHASLLSLYAHPRSSSATLRGRFVRTKLLCGHIPPPPADVDTSIPEPSADAPTLRDRIGAHLETPVCASCHRSMDPIGLGLENFDGLGVFRETEAGARIDASGDLDDVPFVGLRSLAQAVRDHEDFTPCVVEQMVRAAIGRDPVEAEEEAMTWLEADFTAHDRQFQDLLRSFALSPMFRTVGEVSP
jgi:hypothetical protein